MCVDINIYTVDFLAISLKIKKRKFHEPLDISTGIFRNVPNSHIFMVDPQALLTIYS
jgi:hypothetical protein